MEGTADIARGEENRQEIEKSLEKPADSEFRMPVLSRMVLDDLLADAVSRPMGERRNVPVKLSVHIDLFHHGEPVRLQTAVEIVNRNPPCQGGRTG